MNRFRPLRSIIPLFGLILVAGPAGAQSGTWSQAIAGTYNWSDPTDWANGVVADGSGNTATFETAGLTGAITVTLDSNRTIGNLTFDNPTNMFSWTLAGMSTMTLAGTTPTIEVNNANITATINTTLAGTAGLTTSGPGTLVLTGNNTSLSGGLNITAGTVVVAPTGSNNPLGTGSIMLAANAQLAFRGLTAATATYSNALSLPGTTSPNFHFLSTDTSVNVTMGPLTLGNQAILLVQPGAALPANQPYSFTFGPVNATIGSIDVENNGTAYGKVTLGAVSGTGPFNVDDKGIVVLTAPGTYSVGTNVEFGRLILASPTGSATGSNVVNLNGGTLGGVGTVSGIIQYLGHGGLAPGEVNYPARSPGILHVSGVGVVNSSFNTFQVGLYGATTPGTDYDQLSATGTVNISNVTLVTTLGYQPAGADMLTIIQAGTLTGQFGGLPDGASFPVGSFNSISYMAEVHYTPTTVYLTGFAPVPVPEPHYVLLAAGLVAAGLHRVAKKGVGA
jgi:hypothetical protein